jgi:hypothetical protein
MAACCVPRHPLVWFIVEARRVLLSAWTVVLVSCGGGQSDPAATAGGIGPTPAPILAPDSTQPPPAPAQLVVGTALSIDNGARGNPVNLRLARSANGDGFAVWQADDGTRRNLWANRYRAATATWGSPINIETSSADIDDVDLAVDPSGNATVVWHEVAAFPQYDQGVVMSARFEANVEAWAAPVTLNEHSWQARVASDATGAVLAVYVFSSPEPGPYTGFIRGRFFDPTSGTWQPEAAIEQNHRGIGYSNGPAALLDGSGNAFVGFAHSLNGDLGIVASNYYSRSTGSWDQLPPSNHSDVLGTVPGSFPGPTVSVQLAASTDGNFLMAWESPANSDATEIFVAHFMSLSRTWGNGGAQKLVPRHPPQRPPSECNCSSFDVHLQRIGSDAGGNALVLWTEGLTEGCGTRTALKAIRVDPAGAASGAVQVIDGAVGGGAGGVDLGVDPQGHAIAIWQQHKSNRSDDLSPSNIAINRFNSATGTWAGAVLAETQDGNAISPRASASGGQALLGWIQSEGGTNRVKALLQPLGDTPGQ